MQKSRFFCQKTGYRLDEDINKWLGSDPTIKIVASSLAVNARDMDPYVALIIYEGGKE